MNYIIFILAFLINTEGYSMRPAAQQIIDIKIDQYTIISEPESISGKNITKIYESKLLGKKLIWSFEEYIGKKTAYLSPDGSTLILFGNVYFGTTVRDDKESILLEIRNSRGKIITYTYSDLRGYPLSDDIEKYKLQVKGGGWVSLGDLLNIETIDWSKNIVKFKQLEINFEKKY